MSPHVWTVYGIGQDAPFGHSLDNVAVDLFDDVQTELVTVQLEVNKLTKTYGISVAIGPTPLTPVAGNIGLALDPARGGNFL